MATVRSQLAARGNMSTSCASSADVLNVGAGSPLVPSNVGVERNVTIAAGAVWRIGDNATTLLQVGKTIFLNDK